MGESYTPTLAPAKQVVAAMRDVGGITVTGYLISSGKGNSFVASPKKTLESIASAHRGLVPLEIAHSLVNMPGFSPYLVQRYLPLQERFEFIDWALHPAAID